MSETTNVSLSPRAVAARSQITAIKRRIDEIGMSEVYKLSREIFVGLDVFEQKQIEDVLHDIGPETPEQARKNACDLLRRIGLRSVALALENAQLDLHWIEYTISKATTNDDVPDWVRKILQDRLEVAQSSLRRMTEVVNPSRSKPKNAPKDIGNVRSRISSLLDQMRQGRWVYNIIKDEFTSLNGDGSTVSDLMELVEQEKDRCLEKCRPAASDHLEIIGHPSAARAIYDDFDGAEYSIQTALEAKNVYGWIKALLIYRLHQIREATRERQFDEHRTAAIADVQNFSDLIDQIKDVLDCASDAPVSAQQALLCEAQDVYKIAEKIQFFFPALESVIAGKGSSNNFVTKLLQKDAELAKKVGAAPEGKKATALRWGLLKSAEEGMFNLATVVERRTPAQPESTEKRRPNLIRNFDDSRDCRFRGHC